MTAWRKRSGFSLLKGSVAISMMIRAFRLAALVILSATSSSAGASCDKGRFESIPYTACIVDPAGENVRLFYRTESGALIGSFAALADKLEAAGEVLAIAMNGGMYHPDRRPVGLYIEDGREISALVLSDGPGNFGLLPNGVFCLGDGRARIVESRTFARQELHCDFASQSGPLLVEDGRLHPEFLRGSTSRFLRNGVGVRPDGALVLAISDAPVSFHRFARLFRDRLGAPDALYIDGRVSRLYAPQLGRADIGLPMGPIIGVVRRAD